MRLIDLDEFLRQNCVDRMDGKTCDECKHHVLEVSCERLMEQPTAEVTLCHLDSPCEYQNADIAMPSVQPEIIRCKDCKYMIDTGDDLMCDNAKGWVVATASDFGCVLAERRTDG